MSTSAADACGVAAALHPAFRTATSQANDNRMLTERGHPCFVVEAVSSLRSSDASIVGMSGG
jgi:hypothetical protein